MTRGESERENKGKITNQMILVLILGISIGCLFSIAWDTKSVFHQQFLGTTRDNNNGLAGHEKKEDDDETKYVDKLKRFQKYYQTYQYIPPASRYDYDPVPHKTCGTDDFSKWWQLNLKDRSRHGEDKIIYETFFKNYSSSSTTTSVGTYVEIGAYNGRLESNTRFFDLCLGWKGLLVEGNPDNYQGTIANRRYAHRMSLAPSCDAAYEAANQTIPFYRYPMTNAGLVGHAKTYEGKPTVDVPCGPFAPILRDIFDDEGNALPTIDFFSLDVEGAEPLVLSTIDFKAIRIHVMMIEVVNSHCGNICQTRNDVRAKMEAEGYLRYEGLVRNSDVYVHPQSPFQIPTSVRRAAAATTTTATSMSSSSD